jgi:hypothetical protein
MGGNLQGEPAVSSSVNELATRRLSQCNPAEYKRARIKAQCLAAGLTLLADKLDRVELLQATLANSYRR